MRFKIFVFVISLISCNNIYSQSRKIDTTLKIGNVGYRLVCNNKKADKNEASLKPIGFEGGAREMGFYVKGRIDHAEIDDFNNDGFPDLIFFSYGGNNPNDYVNIYTIASAENKSFVPIFFPDILDDAKLREGYKGHDEFSLMEGTILRSFPVYKLTDAIDKPTGGKRVVQYKIFSIEGGYKFKVLRTYELKQ